MRRWLKETFNTHSCKVYDEVEGKAKTAVTKGRRNVSTTCPDPPKTVSDLPDEIILLIASFLSPVDESILNFRAVCRRFKTIADQSCLYGKRSSIRIGQRDNLSFSLFVRFMESSAKTIRKVDLSGCDDVNDFVLGHIVKTCHRIKELNIRGCGQVTNVGMRLLAQLRCLESLDIGECPWITPSGLFVLVTICGKTLRKLRMKNCLGMRTCGKISYSFGRYCPRLTQLSLSWNADFGHQYPPVKLNLIKFTTRFHRVEYLDISFNECNNVDLTELGLSCPRLRYLKAHHVFQDHNLTRLGNGLLQLHTLDITDSWKLTDIGLSSIIERCPQIKVLILTRCHELRGRGIIPTISLCKNLRQLLMDYCFHVDEKALEWIGAMSNSLMCMDISHNVNITSATVHKIHSTRATHGRMPVDIKTRGCPGVYRDQTRFPFQNRQTAV